MAFVMIVVGVPGSGKSTVLEETLALCPELKVVNYGARMIQEASSQLIEKDQIRKLPLEQQEHFGILAAQSIAREAAQVLCVDTHAFVKTPLGASVGGYRPGIPQRILHILKPHAIVMIESAPASIEQRRQFDKSRDRDRESVEQIALHQQISRSFCVACCAATGALFVPISNDGPPREAAKRLADLVEAFAGVESSCATAD
jgi:adenylate kinase